MHCYICDREMTDKEIVYNKDLEGFEACTDCVDEIIDTVYEDLLEEAPTEDHVLISSFDSVDNSEIPTRKGLIDDS